MEYVIGAIVWIGIIIFFIAQNSEKKTKRERYKEAANIFVQKSADTMTGVINGIMESEDEEKIRIARDLVAYRNGQLYRFDEFYDDSRLSKLLTVDKPFKEKLDILGLSVPQWQEIGIKMLYLGLIRKHSRLSFDYSKKNDASDREYVIRNWPNDKMLKEEALCLIKGLEYFGIGIDEYIKYGDAVIEMYNILDQPDLREFGYKTEIMPHKNNYHLL